MSDETSHENIVFLFGPKWSLNSINYRKSSLLTTKTKVAPIKRLSIPSLELCATEILVKLTSK